MAGILRSRWACVSLLAMCWLVGCGGSKGPPRVAVRGAILFQNEMLKAGRITFTPIDGSKGPAAVATVTDGFYDFNALNGPVVGKNKVQIESILDPGFAMDDDVAYAKASKEKGGAPVLPQQPIPPEFNQQSKLVVEVSPEGEKKLDFSL
ncbi:MAG TPA: hypothetical protein VGM98_14995 [Schlesneria sp.]|jgi:hypothetical protein